MGSGKCKVKEGEWVFLLILIYKRARQKVKKRPNLNLKKYSANKFKEAIERKLRRDYQKVRRDQKIIILKKCNRDIEKCAVIFKK